MITCVGNSHANFFTNSAPGKTHQATVGTNFTSYSIGPVIAYNFYEHHLPKVYEALQICKTPRNSYVMLVVGEVDCRWHLPKRINDSKQPRDKVVEECAQRFFRAVLDLQKQGYRPIVWCGHPSTTEGHRDDPSQPIWGDCKARNAISCLWRDALLALATKSNLPCVDILNTLIDNNGLTKMEYFQDYCHLNPSKLLPIVTQKFQQQGLL